MGEYFWQELIVRAWEPRRMLGREYRDDCAQEARLAALGHNPTRRKVHAAVQQFLDKEYAAPSPCATLDNLDPADIKAVW